MRLPITTLCSLSLLFWGYQTGAWALATLMIIALELRGVINHRWRISWNFLKIIHILSGILWIISIIYLPTTSPFPLEYAAKYQILRCLPIAFFPLILLQTYCVNFSALYRDILRDYLGTRQKINFCYLYFPICLLSASATGGYHLTFLTTTVILVTLLLDSLRTPKANKKSSKRFNHKIFYSLIGLSLIASILATNKLNSLQIKFDLQVPSLVSNLVQDIASYPFKEKIQNADDPHSDMLSVERIQGGPASSETNDQLFSPITHQDPVNSFDPEKNLTQIGQSGSIELSNAVLFRIDSNPDKKSNNPLPATPLRIREATYNQYTKGTWNAEGAEFVPQSSHLNQEYWRFGPQTPKTKTVRISTQLPKKNGILKLPMGTSVIEQLAGHSIQLNQYGTVDVQGKPGELSYTVRFDETQSLDSPPTQVEMEVSETEQPTLQKILRTLDLEGKSDAEIVEIISNFFTEDFQYSLELPQSEGDMAPISNFLLQHRSGHCEYFASATSLLLREAGIPTRYAVGYSVHEYNALEQQYIVRARDAHAWVLAYVNGSWVTVDTTPGGGISQSTDLTSGQRTLPEQSTSPSLQENITSLQKNISSVLSSLISQSSNDLGSILLLAGGIVLIVAIAVLPLLVLVWKLVRKFHHQRSQGASPSSSPLSSKAAEPDFYMIERRLEGWGLKRKSSEPLIQWISRLEKTLPTAQMNQLRQIIDLHHRARFDPIGISLEDRAMFNTLIRSWLDEYRQYKTVEVARGYRVVQ